MKKCICIPVEQYERMLTTYDKVVEELEKMKKALEELANSTKSKQPGHLHNGWICLGYTV